MTRWIVGIIVLLMVAAVAHTSAWVRNSPVITRIQPAVILERAATKTYVQEVSGGCDVYAPADETEGGPRLQHVQCWNVWLVSDDGTTRTRLVRVWGMRALEWANAYQQRFERDAFLLYGGTPASPRAIE